MTKLILSRKIELVKQKDIHPFHMPGHKGTAAHPVQGRLDVTELPGLDNLHRPRGVIAAAQRQVAGIYQVPHTYFLVNGSSVGIMAAMAALLAPQEKVLVERCCHKAVISGLVHTGAVPVFLDQEYCPKLRAWLPPTVSTVAKSLAAHQVTAAIFTNPSYMGLAPDIGQLACLCRQYGVKLIVDEAHGAHLAFGRRLGLPVSAVAAGADVVVQSPHKTLGALTQAAWAHVIAPDLAGEFQCSLNTFHTTSPSYLLLASLEHAALEASSHGHVRLARLKQQVEQIREICCLHGLESWRNESRDWTKLVLEQRLGADRILRQAGIFHEMNLDGNMLFLLTMTDACYHQAIDALISQLPFLARLAKVKRPVPTHPPLPVVDCSPREAWYKPGRLVPITRAVNHISRQMVAPYPPGTVVVAPGQKIDAGLADYLAWLYDRRVVPGWIEVI